MRSRRFASIRLLVLVLSIVVSISSATADLLNSAGVFVAGYIGFWGDAAISFAFLAVGVFAVVMSVWSLVKRRRSDKAYLAVLLQGLTFAILWTGILQRRVEKWNFESRLSRRAEVVELVRQGKLQSASEGPCNCFYAELPRQYSNVSAGHEVLVSRHAGGFSVTFFVAKAAYWGDDNYSAFIYRADESEPRTGDEDTDHFFEIRRIRQHWFFVRHT